MLLFLCITDELLWNIGNITDNILPKVAVRQFVLSVPNWIRYYVGRHSELSHKVLKIFISAIEQQYKQNASAPTCAQIGTVTFIQRFGSSLN